MKNDSSTTVLASTGLTSITSVRIGHTTGVKTLPFFIDVYNNPQEIGEYEKIGIQITWAGDSKTGGSSAVCTAMLGHAHSLSDPDIMIRIPMLLS